MEIIKSLIPTAHAADVSSIDDVVAIINRVGGALSAVFFAVAAVYIIMAGWTFLQSKGEAAKLKSARDQVIYAAVAIAVALLAYSIRPIVESIVG
ncbi:MAG: hypothetical protein PHP35_01050 [Candidatus Colwellbacteria bacterium]|nr:hypothetical protein [Candidatus Colwellbacteria bacterium]